MNPAAFVQLDDGRLWVRIDQILAIRALGESDGALYSRAAGQEGRLRLGIPPDSVAELTTVREKYYIKTDCETVLCLMQTAWEEMSS